MNQKSHITKVEHTITTKKKEKKKEKRQVFPSWLKRETQNVMLVFRIKFPYIYKLLKTGFEYIFALYPSITAKSFEAA